MFSSPSSWTSFAFARSRLLHVRVRNFVRGTPTTPFASFFPSAFGVSRRHFPPAPTPFIKASLLRQSAAAAGATPQRKKLLRSRVVRRAFCNRFLFPFLACLIACLLPSFFFFSSSCSHNLQFFFCLQFSSMGNRRDISYIRPKLHSMKLRQRRVQADQNRSSSTRSSSRRRGPRTAICPLKIITK